MNRKLIITLAYYLIFILLGVTTSADGSTILKLAEHTTSKINEINWVFFFGALGYLIGSYLGGRFYDRIPGHALMTAMLIGLGIFIIFIPLTSSLIVLLALVLIAGSFRGALDVGGNTLLLWLHNENVGPLMNGLHACFGMGAFIGPLIVAGVLRTTGDIYWVYWIFAMAAFPLAVFVWRLPSPSPRAVPQGHDASSFPIIPVIVMVLCFTLYVGAEIGFGNWLYAYAYKGGFESEITANYLTSAFWGFFTLGRLLAIWISTRLRPITILFLDFAGCLLSLGLILLFRDSTTILWTGSLLLGLSLASVFPTLLTLSEERMHITGTITGWFLVGGSLGGMIIPVLIGDAFERIGPSAMITIVFVSIVLNLAFLFSFLKISTPRNLKPLTE